MGTARRDLLAVPPLPIPVLGQEVVHGPVGPLDGRRAHQELVQGDGIVSKGPIATRRRSSLIGVVAGQKGGVPAQIESQTKRAVLFFFLD